MRIALQTEEREGLAYAFAQEGDVFSDSSGEDEGVDAVQGDDHGANAGAEAR
jgi:hypothetical protein